ncbi:uncharacterized protein MONOS_10790 [Monocercomonoides exilis]|uniref:uncharacterized protein n=1 Tax=Monocercomonoides exilis TaxID=2049356 RepID=UPI00355A9658|nr:hypothetical protein MONOS_10790 [Monocercomonoides exilis]|eukprot:MONOS_10790.1-p1 / transcript=MONOS_10790.1 / gene=MONOS_10790 / organism=Monocercomonoides_exilis_PA203 / gene_product=unspecified product / transcript_product=unspecified product / location=Mono_scaffold00505:17118-17465(+) / protein_length=92 / sequence_SO=supercontig / SO=protein_coding / is_pseudo=false
MEDLSDIFQEELKLEENIIEFPEYKLSYRIKSIHRENQHVAAATSTILWGGATALGGYLLNHKHIFQKRSVLEIGCGIGLPGMIASRMNFC